MCLIVTMKDKDILIYVLCYDDASNALAEKLIESQPDCFKILRLGPSKYYESQVFKYLDENMEEWVGKEYVGTISYKFTQKTNTTITDLLNKIQAIKLYKPDVIALWGAVMMHSKTRIPMSFIESIGFQHGTFCILALMKLLGSNGYTEQQVMDKSIRPFFGNFWIATPEWMLKYIVFVNGCMNNIAKSPSLASIMNERSYYGGTLSKEYLKLMSGQEHYTLHPFVFERLPCFYFHLEKAKIAPVVRQLILI